MKQASTSFSDNPNPSDTFKWHRSRITVQVSDTDHGGGVYHGRYFALYNTARDAFFADMGIPYLSLINAGLNLSIAELHTRYIKPVYYGDAIMVWTRISWMRDRSLGIIQKMMCDPPASRETRLKNRVEINLVCTDSDGQAVCLPAQFVRAVETYYGHPLSRETD